MTLSFEDQCHEILVPYYFFPDHLKKSTPFLAHGAVKKQAAPDLACDP